MVVTATGLRSPPRSGGTGPTPSGRGWPATGPRRPSSRPTCRGTSREPSPDRMRWISRPISTAGRAQTSRTNTGIGLGGMPRGTRRTEPTAHSEEDLMFDIPTESDRRGFLTRATAGAAMMALATIPEWASAQAPAAQAQGIDSNTAWLRGMNQKKYKQFFETGTANNFIPLLHVVNYFG